MSIFFRILSYNNLEVMRVMKPLKEKISITIDADILERARSEAERDDRSLSQYINLVLREHIKVLDDKKINNE